MCLCSKFSRSGKLPRKCKKQKHLSKKRRLFCVAMYILHSFSFLRASEPTGHRLAHQCKLEAAMCVRVFAENISNLPFLADFLLIFTFLHLRF